MNQQGWTDEARREYDEVCAEAWESGGTTRERVTAYLDRLADAIQAHRAWAYKVEREVMRAGAGHLLKRWSKNRSRVLVTYADGTKDKPRVIGTTRTDAAGNKFHQQVLFDEMTWEELSEKRVEYLRQIKSYGENVAIIDRLLALHDLAPDAATPAQAAKELGTTVADWLGEQAA